MSRAALIAIFFILSCDPTSGPSASPKTTVKNEVEEKVPKKIPTQSFEEGMKIFCGIDFSTGSEPLADVPKRITNVQVLAELKSMKAMTTSLKKERLISLLGKASLSDCRYHAFLAEKIEKERIIEEANAPLPFEEIYLGEHVLRVNRVNSSMTKGKARIVREGKELILDASVKKGKYRLSVKGKVFPKSEKEFILEGELKGVPDLSWRNAKVRERTTKGKFLFRATKGRKFWRLYRVNGRNCVCHDGCGNEFCYIDLRPKSKK